MIKKSFVLIVVFLVVVILGFLYFKNNNLSSSDSASSGDQTKRFNNCSEDQLIINEEQLKELSTGGPVSHNIYRLNSQDGLNFSAENNLLLSSASVPDAVKTSDGRTLLYFVSGVSTAHGIWVAEVEDSGLVEVLDCLSFDGQAEEGATDPNVSLMSDGSLRLVYLSNFGKQKNNRVIKSAVSEDGINFSVEDNLIQPAYVSDPTETMLKDGSFLLAAPSIGDQLDFYVSLDGRDFSTKRSSLKIDGGIFGDLITMPDGTVRFYVGGESLRMFQSTDEGISWTEQKIFVGQQSVSQHGIGMPSIFVADNGDLDVFYISSDKIK